MTTVSKPQVHGPFADAEVSIYCDESRHEGQRQKYMVIGGGEGAAKSKSADEA